MKLHQLSFSAAAANIIVAGDRDESREAESMAEEQGTPGPGESEMQMCAACKKSLRVSAQPSQPLLWEGPGPEHQ